MSREETHYRASLDHLRSSLRWLVASAGAIAAALVAGLQLTNLATLPWFPLLIALGAAIFALSITFAFLIATAKVLTQDRLTATELSNREIRAGLITEALRVDPVKDDSVIRWIQERRTYLLGPYTTVTALYSDGLIGSIKAAEQLKQGNKVSWRNRKLNPASAEDLSFVETAAQDATKRIELTEDAAQYAATALAYRSLLAKMPWWAIAFCISVIVFATIPSLAAPTKVLTPVTKPTPVRVVILDPEQAGLGPGCGAETQGVAVGGTFERPVIALTGTPDCPARVLDRADGVVVVPLIAP